MNLQQLKIIQGGMGIRVSSWKLAKAVSQKGQLGVVSGTAIDTIVARILQLGDKDGSVRHALDHFPLTDMAHRVKERFFHHRDSEDTEHHSAFKGIGMPSINLSKAKVELLIVANFVEVFLAKEGHDGWVGINYLEKIQVPTLPSLFGAMLAGVNVVLMGAGIPSQIPGIMDDLAAFNPVSQKIYVENNQTGEEVAVHFDPRDYLSGDSLPMIQRPAFLAIVSSDIIAKSLERKATGSIEGYVVENFSAGGHNAPPRRDRSLENDGLTSFGQKDEPDLEKIRAIGKPFWLAGQFTTPEKVREALVLGATGVQVGTPFAYCVESGVREDIRHKVIQHAIDKNIHVETSFVASPTGYPFKLVHLGTNTEVGDNLAKRKRVCDMGYLRTLFRSDEGKLIWRCPAEPVEEYVKKQGSASDCEGRLCLCNGLAATVGYGQQRKQGAEPYVLTSGEDIVNLDQFATAERIDYTASDVIDRLLS